MRRFLFCVLVICASASAQTTEPATNAAVSGALAYLSHQQQADGSFATFDDSAPRGRSTAAAVLAYLSAGHTPMHGRYSLVVHNALAYLLRTSPGDGYFGLADESGTSGQGIILIALAEAYGMEGDATQRGQIKPLLRAGLAATLAMQDSRNAPDSGGWGEQGEKPGTLTVTAITVLSLRALRDAGIDVPADAIHRAASFAKSCRKDSAFADPGKVPTPASTTAGICILLLAKEIDSRDPSIGKSVPNSADKFDELSTYVNAVGLLLSNDTDAQQRGRALRDSTIAKQSPDGSWAVGHAQAGTVFATSTAVLSLTTSYRLLPIYPISK